MTTNRSSYSLHTAYSGAGAVDDTDTVYIQRLAKLELLTTDRY